MAVPQPTDAELNEMIRIRLASVGIDLSQLPAGTAPDPETGAPGRDEVVALLRDIVRTTSGTLSAYQFQAPEGDPKLAQQVAPPSLYPSIDSARRRR
ncbi:hypothetical protein ACI2LF_26465 [Kribbella sp. NPDC020789]